jgi:hypothetical protein
MRRPYLVGLKCRELQKKHFERFAASKLSVCPENCRHNQEVTILGLPSPIRVCTAAQRPGMEVDTHKIVVCQSTVQASECRIYDPRYVTKDDVSLAFKELLSDPALKLKMYPDVVALEWVLDSDLHEATQLPGAKVRVILKVISFLERVLRRLGVKQRLLSWSKKPEPKQQDPSGIPAKNGDSQDEK